LVLDRLNPPVAGAERAFARRQGNAATAGGAINCQIGVKYGESRVLDSVFKGPSV
jgi:hypothetical protein